MLSYLGSNVYVLCKTQRIFNVEVGTYADGNSCRLLFDIFADRTIV